jgi:hypothetical protein
MRVTLDKLSKSGEIFGFDAYNNPVYLMDGNVWVWGYITEHATNLGPFADFWEFVLKGSFIFKPLRGS